MESRKPVTESANGILCLTATLTEAADAAAEAEAGAEAAAAEVPVPLFRAHNLKRGPADELLTRKQSTA